MPKSAETKKKAELQRLEESHANDLKELAQAVEEAKKTERLLEEVQFEIQKDPDGGKVAGLKAEQKNLHEEVNLLRETGKTVHEKFDTRHSRWTQWIKHGQALQVKGLEEALEIDDSLLADLRTGKEADRLRAMQSLAETFNGKIWRSAHEVTGPFRHEIAANEARLRKLAEDLENLDKGRAPGAFALFQAVRQKLGNRVEQLGRLIEVKPEAERWWPALELFLGRNRWIIIVNDSADYRQALEILKNTPAGHEPESLLNPAEAKQLRVKSHARSLFTKVDVAHPVARQYVEHLLGDVLCVENIDELESAEAGRAITPEGIFKQAPLRRRLKPADSVSLTLGREGIKRMRKVMESERDATRAENNALKQRLDDINAWLDTGKKGGLGDVSLPERAAELSRLPGLEAKLAQTRETIRLLMTPEREARQKNYEELKAREKEINASVAVLKDRKSHFEISLQPGREALARAAEEAQTAGMESESSRVELSRRFKGILDGYLAERRDKFRSDFPKWGDCFDKINSMAAKAGADAAEARVRRSQERERLATQRDEHGNLRHPEYQGEFQIEDEDNAPWSARLRVLDSVELEKSRQLAADCKRDWERRLEENVLNELNRRIKDAQQTIRHLDRYLSQPVGKHRYRLSQRRDLAGYGAIWRLLDTGLEPTDPLAAAVQDQDVQRAKDQLMKALDSVEGKDADAAAMRLLDYRNYHHYDLEMVPADKPDAPPISLSRSGRNLSGGEGQAPFFISMLAAFRRVYDKGDRASAQSRQLGLVVMDEAFSKLSGDGIDDCLALADSFQLQLVMAFPPERLGVMVPHARTVVICQKEIERDAQGYVKNISNIPLITTMAEAMEALAS